MKFIYIFSGKDLLFAQRCDSNFGGNPPEGKGRAEGTTNIWIMQDFNKFY